MNLIPSNNTSLIGYNKIFLELKNLFDNNILPNKIIFSGNNGIGKSTFAYHLTNYIFSKDEGNKYNSSENLILNSFLIPIFGLYGAASSFMLAFGLFAYLSLKGGQKYYPIPYVWKNILFYLLFSFLIVTLNVFFLLIL